MPNSHKTSHPPQQGKQLSILVKGIVQGVGFRPFVYNLARGLHLAGQVANTGRGVEIHIQGNQRKLCAFLDRLRNKPPAASRIDSIQVRRDQEAVPINTFSIIASEEGHAATLVSPDLATCQDCLAEILDPANRRFDYPFTNCTNCGPRLTIIKKIPYDRSHTSMTGFAMCPECRREYEDPTNRRFHAQPNACPVCGPRVSWHDRDGNLLSKGSTNVLDACAEALSTGAIVAIKGLGGFHLAVDATSDKAIARLRRKKIRPDKPLAVMVRDLETLQKMKICRLEPAAKKLLQNRQRPIVLLAKSGLDLNEPLAPGMAVLGVMLPYTPIHHLLFVRNTCPDLLVMTSGNKSGAPICTANEEAISELADIADFFLLHNRDIVTRVDDSVARVTGGRVRLVRRARGYAPLPVAMNGIDRPILACGAELKNTFCITRPGEAFVSQHMGDLKRPDNMVFFEQSVRYYKKILEINPEIVVRDLHPDYLSSRYADGTALPSIRIQHHQAHAGAVIAEHGLDECLAVVYDGAGLGEDDTIWGGEIFYIRQGRCLRLAHLRPFSLPGGDTATREIWRIGLSLLHEAGLAGQEEACLPPEFAELDAGKKKTILTMMQKGVNSPLCSSMGRLFDGIASLLGIRWQTSFEAQAAMELESLAMQASSLSDDSSSSVPTPHSDQPKQQGDESRSPQAGTEPGFHIKTEIHASSSTMIVIDQRPLIHRILAGRRAGSKPAELALFFHHWLSRTTAAAIDRICSSGWHQKPTGPLPIVLAGGCFQNQLLLELLTGELENRGFYVYSGEKIPVNDGGIALGQVYLAACAL